MPKAREALRWSRRAEEVTKAGHCRRLSRVARSELGSFRKEDASATFCRAIKTTFALRPGRRDCEESR